MTAPGSKPSSARPSAPSACRRRHRPSRRPTARSGAAVGETRFRQLRRRVLQGALDAIKPKPPGRPSKATTLDAQRLAELERLLAEKELELRQALVREEVALILRAAEDGKKTSRASVKLRKRKPR